MAKQKTIFSRILRKVKQDASRVWTKRKINAFDILNQPIKSIPEDALALQGEGFIHTLQLEALLRSFDEDVCVTDDDEPFLYPGLMAAWESAPTTVEFEREAAEFIGFHMPEILHTPLERVRKLFPACLLCDIRDFDLHLYGLDYDGLFIYPSYDLDRAYPILLIVAVSLKKGLDLTLESKIVLKGDTFLDALDFTFRENRILEERCWAGLDKGVHEIIFSPMENEPEATDAAALALALMCSDFAKVEVLPGSRERRLRVSLVEGAVAAADRVAGRKDASEADETAVAAEDAAENAVPELELCTESDDADETASEEPGKDAEVLNDKAAEEHAVDAPDTANIAVEPAPTEDVLLGDVAVVPSKTLATEDYSSGSAPLGAQDAFLSPVDAEADNLALIAELRAQVASLEAALADQERKSSSLEYHLGQAQAAANQAKFEAASLSKRAELAENMDIPLTPLEALELAGRAFGDRLIFMDQARRSADAFTKGSAREVWAVLRSMAVVLHPLIFGKANGNIIHAFEAQSGFELTFREMKNIKNGDIYRKLRTVTYEGQPKEANAHVKGKGTRKGESLRVHFFADYARNKIVIAHCGEHLQTYETSSL